MKKFFLSLLFFYSLPSLAFNTILTSSIYATEGSYSSPPSSTPIPTTIRRVHFIDRLNSSPEAQTALTAAEYIFSDFMKSISIQLVPIEAEVIWGEASEFALEEVCKVHVYYTDNILNNVYYYYFNQYSSQPIPVLIPKTIYYQCLGTSDGPSMQIKLNPQIDYHFATSTCPSNKYDLITILLRSLAIGCGLQSSLAPNNLQFGIEQNGQTYISAFDTHIYNNLNNTFRDVVTATISAADFLDGKSIYANGQFGYDTYPIGLFNDWQLGSLGFDVTDNTLNTIDLSNYIVYEDPIDSFDLLDPYLSSGMSRRTVTKYTMALLRTLGWIKTLPVDLEYENLNTVYSCTLQCSNTMLLPDQNYTVGLSSNATLSDVVCKLHSNDTTYAIGAFNGNHSFSYSTIPTNVQWRRNPISKNIIGQIEGKASKFLDGHLYVCDKACDIEIPYKPNKPIIHKSESTSDGFITLNLNAFANGSDNYTVSYTGVTYGDVHTFTTTANAIDTIIDNIPATQLYNISICGHNNEGNSDSYNFTFGFSAHPILNMTIAINGNTLRYDLSNNGTIDISDVVVSSVKITNQMGITYINSSAGSGEPIDISSLNRGYYILTVIADGNTYSRMFIKR